MVAALRVINYSHEYARVALCETEANCLSTFAISSSDEARRACTARGVVLRACLIS